MYKKTDVNRILSECLKRYSDMRYNDYYCGQAELAVQAISEVQKSISELESAVVWCPKCGFTMRRED